MYLQEIRKAADVNGIDLAEDWDKQWAFVNLVMKNLVFIIFQEFPDQLKEYWLLKEGCTPWSFLVS